MKIACPSGTSGPGAWLFEETRRTQLYDLQPDPRQERPVTDADAESRMTRHLTALMRECASPPEQFARLGLSAGE